MLRRMLGANKVGGLPGSSRSIRYCFPPNSIGEIGNRIGIPILTATAPFSPPLGAAAAVRQLQELKRPDIPHLDTPYGLHLIEDTAFGLQLPFASLKGPGFERLCFHLLLAQGRSPRFFGESGSAQFGIDLIVSDGCSCEAFQCKNVVGYNAKNLRRDLQKFEREWLVDRPNITVANFIDL
jgi:hypothetical protein